MDQTQVAQIIQRLAAGEQIPGWSYHPEQTNLYGDSQYAQTEPTSAFYNGQGYWADGNPMRNQTLDLGDVAKLAAIMGTAYLGGTALAGSGSTAGSSLANVGNVTQVGTPLAELGAAGVPTAEVGLPGLLAPEATAGSAFTPSMNYGPGMTGAQTSAYDAVIGATGSPTAANVASNAIGPLSKAAEWMKTNPTAGRLLMSGVSGLLSASGGSSGGSGGYKDSGYRPTITRGNWQPSVTPRSMAMTPTSINLPTTGTAGSGLWRYGLLGG